MSSFIVIVGQQAAVSRLTSLADEFLPEHILLIGQEGSGRSTLAKAFADHLGTRCRAINGAEIRLKGDLSSVLANLDDRDLLYIDGVDKVSSPIRATLAAAIRDHRLTITIGKGASARIHHMDLRAFMCMGAISRGTGNTLASLFPVQIYLAPYSTSELETIAKFIGNKLGLLINDDVAKVFVEAADGTPGNLEILIRRVAKLLSGGLSEADVRTALGGRLSHLQDPNSGEHSACADINRMSGAEFEQLIVRLLLRMGFHAEMTQASGDGGIDIVAILNKPIVGGRYLLQCKRFSDSPVGASIVRDFYGALRADQMACKGVIVTTSTFTREAREFAAGVGVELIEGEQLQTLLQSFSSGDLASPV